MILTVTPNTAIDRTLFVPSFALNQTIRASRAVIGMGGKGADASWILGELGMPSRALGFAAGPAGKLMESLLQERGVETDFVWVGGETRVNTLIVAEDGSGQSTITADSLEVTTADVIAFETCYEANLQRATCVVIGGSLPSNLDPALYSQWVKQARARNVPVILDASGSGLRSSLRGRPTVVKPNRHELEELAGCGLPTLGAVYNSARELVSEYGTSVVVTLGEEGALAVLPGRAYRIPAPKVRVVSTAGAGDGVLAGLAVALAQGQSLEDGLRLGFAAAAAVLLTPATADCRHSDVKRLLPTIELMEYESK